MKKDSPGQRGGKVFYGYIIVALALLVMALTSGAIFSFSVFFAPLQEEFGWSRALTSGVFSAFMISQGVFSIFAGRLNDRFGPRAILTVGSVLFGLGFMLVSRVSAVWQIYLLYGLVIAAGASAGPVPLMSTVVRWFHARRGMMTGIVMAGVGIGTMVVPPFSSWLVQRLSWRPSFVVVGVLILVVVFVCARFLRRDPHVMGLHPLGGEVVTGERPQTTGAGLRLAEAMRTKQAWLLAAAFVGFGFSVHTISVHAVVYAMGLGMSPTRAATVMTAIGGLGILGRVGMGSLADSLGSKRLLVILFGVLSLSLLWLSTVTQSWGVFAFACVFGFSFGGIVPLYSHIVAELFGLRAHGAILGIVGFSIGLGSAIGPVFTGYVYDVVGSYAIPFAVCGAAAAISGLLILFVKPLPDRTQEPVLVVEDSKRRPPEPPFIPTM
ncbi:MAG: MFS transporter [Dehalococcoidia bacterium]|nr:MFS transporter [Dehalococcoidia bacterium]